MRSAFRIGVSYGLTMKDLIIDSLDSTFDCKLINLFDRC